MSGGESKVDGTALKYQRPDLEDFTVSIYSCLSPQGTISNYDEPGGLVHLNGGQVRTRDRAFEDSSYSGGNCGDQKG